MAAHSPLRLRNARKKPVKAAKRADFNTKMRLYRREKLLCHALDRASSRLVSVEDKVDDAIRRATKHFPLYPSLLQTAHVWRPEYEGMDENSDEDADAASAAAEAASVASDGGEGKMDVDPAHGAGKAGECHLLVIEALGDEYEYIGFDFVDIKQTPDGDEGNGSAKGEGADARKAQGSSLRGR